MTTRQPLPIDPLLPEIAEALRDSPSLVLEAAPGAGKTTRVPAALLRGVSGEVLVSEPRRLPARLAATRVAEEQGESVGQTVGYSVRFEEVAGPKTRLRYVTEGILVRRLLADPTLRGVSVLVLDEFHERHLTTDLCLTLARRLQLGARPDLRLVVMSATLDADPVAAFLGDAGRVRSEGRSYPVQIEHQPKSDERPLEKQVLSAVRELLRGGPPGDILVFLPGAAEIRRCSEALAEVAAEAALLVLPLHGDLSIEQQARAVGRASQRKVVLSTNVAESSVTIDGVTGVIDSGLARVASYSPWTGLPTLQIAKISRASAAQRAGRAGRTQPGRVLRLFTKGDHDARPEHDPPEIERLDLSETVLFLHALGVAQPSHLPWLSAPPEPALRAAESLLGLLGALDADGTLTKIGRRLLDFAVHPRLGRVLVEAERLGIADLGCLAAALLSERDIRQAARTAFEARSRGFETSGPSDLLELIERFQRAEEARFSRSTLQAEGLDARSVRAVDQARRKLESRTRRRGDTPDTEAAREEALGMAVLAGFPDRVAKRRKAGQRELVLVNGSGARLAETSVVHQAPLLVALDVDEQRTGRGSSAVVRLASAIEPEWLLEYAPSALEERIELHFDSAKERVERTLRTSYGSIVLDEQRTAAEPSEAASQVLARAALANGGQLLGTSGEALERVLIRLRVLREHMPELSLPDLSPEAIPDLVARACVGLTSLGELRRLDLADQVLAELGHSLRQQLEREVPVTWLLPGGRRLPIHYEPGKPPWVASRLQDFFGTGSAPRLCAGRLPVTVHLLAPNQRAVQVTTDLEGFWQRHYPSIRRELMRVYPKHAWPEDGRNATPPAPRAPRRPS